MSRLYVGVVVAASVAVGIINLANRDNVFERVADGVQFATVFLFTVFGLFKLSSDDPSVIRDTFLGFCVVRTAANIVRVCKFESETELKKLLAVATTRQGWLDEQGSCYVVAGTWKGITLSAGISPHILYELGCDFDGNRYFRPGEEKGYWVDYDWKNLHIAGDDRKLLHHNPEAIVAKDLSPTPHPRLNLRRGYCCGLLLRASGARIT